jgi:hypothetical protein
MLTLPAAISAALGVYTAVGVLLLKVPEPEVDQVAAEAPPPNEPFMLMGVLEQAAKLAPALTVAAGLMLNTNELEAAVQGAC